MKVAKKKVIVKKGKKSGEHMMPGGMMMKDSDMKGKKPSKKAMAYMKKVGMKKKK